MQPPSILIAQTCSIAKTEPTVQKSVFAKRTIPVVIFRSVIRRKANA